MQLPKTFHCYRERPLTRMIDMSQVSVGVVAPQTKAAHDKGHKTMPDAEALEYYYWAHWMNHMASNYHKHECIAEWNQTADHFFAHGSGLAVRMFHYVLLICTRESRHAHINPTRKAEMMKKFGPWAYSFWMQYEQTSKPKAVKCWFDLPEFLALHGLEDVTMGEYATYLVWILRRAHYSGGFGGKKWADIAEILRLFVHGEITAEMMIDQSFNASHNNGPIFNKGMLFEDYSPKFLNILDVQRSGQVPNLVTEQLRYGKTWFSLPQNIVMDMEMQSQLKTSVVLRGGCDYVDWFKVEQLGSVGSFYNEKQYQEKNYGFESEYAGQAQKEHLANPIQYPVMEGLEVPVMKRDKDGGFSPYTVGEKLADYKKAMEAKK